ncbi:hypothetical protein ACFX1T_015585 [Malus domestica]
MSWLQEHPLKQRLREKTGKQHVRQKQPADVLVPRPDVETSPKKMEAAIKREPFTVATMRHSSPISSPGKGVAEHNHADAEERDLENTLASLNLNRSSLPARQVTWRGGFIVDAATTSEFIGGFQGRPPCKIHPKAYRFAQTMPRVLKANFLPRSQLWTDIFQDQPPDLQDVGLYFFPDENAERSREGHARLIERMETEDSMMRICFDDEGVELLIFTSEKLQLDKQLTSFLWGVLQCTKNDQVEANMNNNQSVDMEIDMEGENTGGRVDVTGYGSRSNSRKEDSEISSDAERKELARAVLRVLMVQRREWQGCLHLFEAEKQRREWQGHLHDTPDPDILRIPG